MVLSLIHIFEPEQRNKKILDGVRAATFKPLIECLKSIDQDLLKGAVAGEKFSDCLLYTSAILMPIMAHQQKKKLG